MQPVMGSFAWTRTGFWSGRWSWSSMELDFRRVCDYTAAPSFPSRTGAVMDQTSPTSEFNIASLYGQLVESRVLAARARVEETVDATCLFGEGAAALEDAGAVLTVISELAPPKMRGALGDLILAMLSVARDLELAADVAAMRGADAPA